jgi:hypothetical protein
MNHFAPALDIANAVLYEGYILFPYTASAGKNRIRWQFGVVVPQAYAATGTGEPALAQTEVLLEYEPSAHIEVLVRFLQVEARLVEAWNGADFEPVQELAIDGTRHLTFDEGVEREIRLHVRPGLESRVSVPIGFPAQESADELHDGEGALRGRIVRRCWPLDGSIVAEREVLPGHPEFERLRVCIDNHSAVVPGERSSALRTAFVSTHTLLHVSDGRFLSALDPPAAATDATALLRNRHTWPVLVGDQAADAQRAQLVLSSPIILYDFPAVAPQSQGDTFDALEIDELMMLSVRSLSDAEREEAKATDPRARAIVERAERFDAEELSRLHGTLQTGSIGAPETDSIGMPQADASGTLQVESSGTLRADLFGALDLPGLDCVFIDGVKIAKGSSVRLRPKRRADAWDLFLEGKIATVRAVHQDVENLMYVAVTVDDDPASDLHEWYGRSFFFCPDEVEPVAAVASE